MLEGWPVRPLPEDWRWPEEKELLVQAKTDRGINYTNRLPDWSEQFGIPADPHPVFMTPLFIK